MKDAGIVVIIVGVVLLFLKNQIASIESTLQNTWTAVAVIAIGGIMILTSTKHLAKI